MTSANRTLQRRLAGLIAAAAIAVSLLVGAAPASARQVIDMHNPGCPAWRMSDRPYTGFGVIGIDANATCVNWAHGHVLDLPFVTPGFNMYRTLFFVDLDLQRYYRGAWHFYAGITTRLEHCTRILDRQASFLPFETRAGGHKIRVEDIGLCNYVSPTANVHAQTSRCPPAGLWRGVLSVTADEELDVDLPLGVGDVLPHDVKLLSVASGTFNQTRHC